MAVSNAAILIPGFQAGPWIGGVVERALRQLGTVLVVDDGSSDGTGDLARAAGAEVATLGENQGKAAALRLGFSTLFDRGFESVVTLDADGQHPPEEIPKLLTASDQVDLVLGTRAHLFTGMSRLRRTSNRLSSGLISIAAGRSLLDVQTGFRRYGSRLWQDVGFPGERFAAESAIVVLAARRGLRIDSVPISLSRVDGRSSSHYRPLVDSLRIATAVLRARWAAT